MYVDIVPNRSSPPAILLRESRREGNRVKKQTLANLSNWPADQVASLQMLLRGEKLAPVDSLFQVLESLPHGHVEAILGTIRSLGLDRMISSTPSAERDLVLAMIVEQLLHGASKLADTRLWHTTSLAEELRLNGATEYQLYDALDWLLARQPRIERKLAKKHLSDGGMVFYDVTSSYYEGRTCPLARFGYNRDGKTGKQIIVYGTLADQEGRPIGVQVYPGNSADPSTVPDQVKKLQEQFHLNRMVIVGDRGMLTETQIRYLKQHPGLGWISAMKSSAIRKLLDTGELQPSFFDERHLAEIYSAAYPQERLMACYNPLLADERYRKRQELVGATEAVLARIKRDVDRRTKTPLSKQEIAVKVGKVINKFKVAKHFTVTVEDGKFQWQRKEESIRKEEELDGIYVVRTSEPKERISAADTVRQYKNLARIEQLYRTCKGLDIQIRPIRHHSENHVRAHIFLCMLTYYVEWHMRKALRPLLFEDEQLTELRKTRDPVAKAEPSATAKRKKTRLVTDDGLPVHSFQTLLWALGTRCKNRCRVLHMDIASTVVQITPPNPLQRRAFQLLGLKAM